MCNPDVSGSQSKLQVHTSLVVETDIFSLSGFQTLFLSGFTATGFHFAALETFSRIS